MNEETIEKKKQGSREQPRHENGLWQETDNADLYVRKGKHSSSRN